MRRLIAAALAGFALAAPATAGTRTFSATYFDRIRMSGPFKVTLATGGGSSAKAEGDPRVLDRLRLEVQDHTLILALEKTDASSSAQSGGPVTVTLTTPELVAATILGAGTLAVDKIKGERVDLTLSGSGRFDVASLAATRLNLLVAGSGGATVAGKASQLRLVAQGSGLVDLAKLEVQDADVAANGSGDVTLSATRAARGTAEGAGNVTVLGTPACAIRADGVGVVKCGMAPTP